jgi:hypothetical protein
MANLRLIADKREFVIAFRDALLPGEIAEYEDLK